MTVASPPTPTSPTASTVSGTASASFLGFTGRENDSTGTLSLYNYRARAYSPTVHRFLTEDPVGFAGGYANLYPYVGDAPTAHTDPTGVFIDVALDVAFISDDIYSVFTGGRKDLGENLFALGLDLLAMFIPFVTGLGAATGGLLSLPTTRFESPTTACDTFSTVMPGPEARLCKRASSLMVRTSRR